MIILYVGVIVLSLVGIVFGSGWEKACCVAPLLIGVALLFV